MKLKFKVKKKLITLEKLPSGSLFIYGGAICLKSQYVTDAGAIEAHIVGSGEMFWGGSSTPEGLNKLLVKKVKHKIK